MTLRARKTDNGQGIRLSYLLYFAIVGLLSSSNAISLCGSGPHTLESDTLRLYAIAGQQTVIRAKFLSSQETINNIRWWTKPKTAQSLFEDSVTKQKGDTQVTLTMSKELNGVRIRYQMKYTSSDGRKRGFSSASATLIAGDDSITILKGKPLEINAAGGYYVPCFDVSHSTIKSIQIQRKTNPSSRDCQVSVPKSLYTYEDGCVRMGPLDRSHSGGYCILVENCFSRKTRISLQLQLGFLPLKPNADPFTPRPATKTLYKQDPPTSRTTNPTDTPAAESVCGRLDAPNGGMVKVDGLNYYDEAYLVCKDGYQLVGPPTSTCLYNGTWSKFGSCIKAQVTKYGLSRQYTISSDNMAITSPLLLRSKHKTHIKLHYQLTHSVFRIRVQNIIRCFSDLAGKILTQTTSLPIMPFTSTSKSGDMCFGLPVSSLASTCRTYRVMIRADVDNGYVTLSDIQFGDGSICSSFIQRKTTLDCSFDSSDCGITNDACGMVDWEIRSDDDLSRQRRQSTECSQWKGLPLLKRKPLSACSFENLHITDLQPSGFSVDYIDATKLTKRDSRVRRSSGYSVYLDPSKVSDGVAVGILDLPEVYFSISNSFLSFAYDMVEDGLHFLLVAAVCTSDPSNKFLIPLADFHNHYHIRHSDGHGDSGTVCLDIQSYVKEKACYKFVIQITGAAVATVLSVDNVFFSRNLVKLPCGAVSNSRKK
jgi:hypothetical protein